MLETQFPFAEVSAVAIADRTSRDHIYGAHKWWARRPPAVIRALLLAATTPADTPSDLFWTAYSDDAPRLRGHHVGDPFMGGATTVVEAARLGASVTGIDVDPLAVRIARQELNGADRTALAEAGTNLLLHLAAELGALFPCNAEGGAPLHYFFLRQVGCPHCAARSLMYRNLILARDRNRAGGVARDGTTSVFCPECRGVHALKGADEFDCCGRTWNIALGNYAAGRFCCPECNHRVTHKELLTARQPRVLIAVEETGGERRRIRTARDGEDGVKLAARWWTDRELDVPATPLGTGETARARHYGFERVTDLFSARQLALFATAFAYLENAELAEDTRDAMRLAVSNALSANNLLCGYATDYGRVAPLFTGVRAYSMPILSVELNPLHPSAGRGTLPATLRRLGRTDTSRVRRHTFDPRTGDVKPHDFLARRQVAAKLACRSADRGLPDDLGPITLAVSDPPYFDYISYSDLSLFFRAWHGGGARADRLGGIPIYPVGSDAVNTFRDRLAACFAKVRRQLANNALFCFTFHATDEAAWTALGSALRTALFRVTAVFPVWADGRAASHGHDGNCEWDLVFVCRPHGVAADTAIPKSIDSWLVRLDGIEVTESDRRNMALGLECARLVAEGGPTGS